MKYFIFHILIFISISNFAQNAADLSDTTNYPLSNKIASATSGPGGVNATNVLWVKADDLTATLATDDPVDLWSDQSGIGNDALQAVLSDRPSFNKVLRNYNPSIYFDGTNEHLDIADLVAAESTSISVFAVGTNEAGGDSWHSMVFGQANNNWSGGGYGICGLDPSSANFGFWIYQWGSNSVSSFFIEQPTAIIEGKYDGSNISLYYDAQFRGSDSYTNQIGDGGSTHLGGGNETSFNHKGHISEVIIYDTSLSDIDRHKVNSYLGLKYGIILDRIGIEGDYVNSLGNSVYSDEGTSDYWRGIIGIGRDDNGSLLQKQSHEFYDQSRIYISSIASDNASNTGNYSVDSQYAVMGNGGGLVSIRSRDVGNAEAPASVLSRLERDWKLTNTNFTDLFNIDIRLNSCVDIPSIVDTDLRLLVDNDTDFTNATVYQNGDDGLSLSLTGNIISISNIPNSIMGLNSSTYFTIASVTANTLDLSFSAETINTIYVCDELPNDGFAEFPIDLTDIENQVIGPYAALNLDVSYYDNLGNDLTLTDPFTNTSINTQTITVRVTHPYGCYDETTFDLIVIPTPIIDNQIDVTACDTFTLPNLTNGNYFTASGGTGTQLNSGAIISTSQTVYIYAENSIDSNICSDENSFTIGIGTTPTAESVSNIYVCDDVNNDGFAEFPIDTTDLENQVLGSQTGLNVHYYDENGTEIFLSNPYTNITANTQTITVSIEHPYGCIDETTFDLIVVPMPVIAIPDDVTACDSYTLPNLSVGSYFTGTGGSGTQLDPADPIITSQIVYIYAENELDSNICSNESSFTIGIGTTPTAEFVSNFYICDDVGNDGFTEFPIDSADLENQVLGSQTGLVVHYYDENGTEIFLSNPYTNITANTQTITVSIEHPYGCVDDTTFDLIVVPMPIIAIPDDISACDLFTLPTLSVGNYFTETGGAGTQLDPSVDLNTTQIVYIYAENSIDSNICINESSYTITINTTPTVDILDDVPGVCGSYILPNLTTGNYFSESGGTGTAYNYGDAITTSQRVYIYAETATTPNCTDESSFDVIIYPVNDFMLSVGNIIIQDQNITVVMSDTSIEYEYALDNNAIFQSENSFYFLSEETHELFVRDIHGCVEKSILFNPAHNIVFSIVPNPTTDNFSVHSSEIVTKVEVYDVSSKLLISYPSVLESYPIPNLSSGIYFVRIESETGYIGFERMIVN